MAVPWKANFALVYSGLLPMAVSVRVGASLSMKNPACWVVTWLPDDLAVTVMMYGPAPNWVPPASLRFTVKPWLSPRGVSLMLSLSLDTLVSVMISNGTEEVVRLVVL